MTIDELVEKVFKRCWCCSFSTEKEAKAEIKMYIEQYLNKILSPDMSGFSETDIFNIKQQIKKDTKIKKDGAND